MGVSVLNPVSQFAQGWSPAYLSMKERIHVLEVNQGGNYILSALPQAAQAAWAGVILARLAKATPCPLKGIFKPIRYALSPFVGVPTCLIAAAVKEGFYESSIETKMGAQVKHFATREVPEAIPGTVSLMLDGVVRHFNIGQEITEEFNTSIEIDEAGEKKFYYYGRLLPEEELTLTPEQLKKVREVNINGQLTRIRLRGENTDRLQGRLEIVRNGETRYYTRGKEEAVPVQGTIESRRGWHRAYHLIGDEIPAAAPGSIQINVPEQIVHYEVSQEQKHPSERTRTFEIKGKKRHYLSVKSVPDHTWGLAELFNKIPKCPIKLPRNLRIHSVKTLKFIAEKISTIIRVITVVAAVAFLALGHFFIAGGILLVLAYEVLDHNLGVVPRKVSLFVERWMPLVSLAGIVLVGSVIAKVMAVAVLLTFIPPVKRFMFHQLDRLCRKVIIEPMVKTIAEALAKKNKIPVGRRESPSEELEKIFRQIPLMKDLDAPVVERKTMNFEEIKQILNAPEDHFQIDFAHCTKAVEPLIKLPEDRNFDQLIELWGRMEGPLLAQLLDTENRPEYYRAFMTRLTDDKRFILFLQKRFPEAKRFRYEEEADKGRQYNATRYRELEALHRTQMEQYITTLAQEKGQTNSRFMLDWTKDQLQLYVKKLHGKNKIEGPQILLEQAIENTAKIIPFLTAPQADQILLEDTLIKLAIEGGDYCTLAMNRASNEVLDGFMEPLLNAAQEGVDSNVQYEKQLLWRLQRERLQMIQGGFEHVFGMLRSKEAFRDTAEDVHLYQAITLWLKRGFYHLQKHEERDFGLTEFMVWETGMLPVRAHLLKAYKERIKEIVRTMAINHRAIRESKTLNYLTNWVNQNPSLTPEQRVELLQNENRRLQNDLANTEDNLLDPNFHIRNGRLLAAVLGLVTVKPPEPLAAAVQVQAQGQAQAQNQAIA